MIDIRRMHTSYRDCLVFAMSSAAREEIVVFFSFDVGGNEMLYSTGGLACNHHQLGIFGCNVALEYMSLIGNCKHHGYEFIDRLNVRDGRDRLINKLITDHAHFIRSIESNKIYLCE